MACEVESRGRRRAGAHRGHELLGGAVDRVDLAGRAFADPRVVDQHVEVVVPLADPGEHLAHLLGIRDVGPEREVRVLTAGQVPRGGGRPFDGEVVDGDARALDGEALGDRPADSRTRAGHESDPRVQLPHAGSLYISRGVSQESGEFSIPYRASELSHRILRLLSTGTPGSARNSSTAWGQGESGCG